MYCMFELLLRLHHKKHPNNILHPVFSFSFLLFQGFFDLLMCPCVAVEVVLPLERPLGAAKVCEPFVLHC